MIGNKKEIINWLLNKDDIKEYEIKEYKKKRGLSANSYCWVLIQKLADVLGTTKEELYKQYIHDKGIFKTIEIQNKAVGTITYCWNNMGLGFVYDIISSNDKTTELALYYGTSTYNTKQMATFIDYIVEEAKEQGIETLTPVQIQELKDNWNKKE